MRSLSWIRAGWTVALGFAAATLGANSAAAKPVRPIRSRAVNLFALPVHVMNVNRVVCPIVNNGQVCVDSTQSPVLEGAFWPKGTPDSYVFNSGLQASGIIKAATNFPWNGDTVGVFFMDPRGDQLQGDGVTQVWSSLDANDVANWPTNALVHDAALFDGTLLGRKSVSQEDLWVRAWDGSPARLAGRTHPMGILVEERGMAWNYPTGNEDIDYFIYTFYNISASNCAVYHNPSIDPSIADSLCDIGKNFQALNSQHFGVTFPDTGYAFVNLFAAFFEDCDVGNASFNYSTPIPLFNLGFCWKSDFLEPTWAFPPDVYHAPFAVAPGLTGTKYLASPNDSTGKPLGVTLFSNTINAANNFPDAVGVKQLFRYHHGTTSPAAGDFPCSFQGQQLQRHYCFLAQTAQDTRFFISSGPFTLAAGQAQTLVVAYMYAPPTTAILPYVGGDLAQGIPPTDTGLARAVNPDTLRTIDRGAGWVSHSDLNKDGKIEQNEVVTLPGSLLNKALVAQAVFDNKFLLPFAPEPPNFYLVPGDNQVTVAWEKSNTEFVGNPFYTISSKPTVIPSGGGPPVANPLYDPNFRQFDVEGYRVYRGRTSGALQIVAQFDYANTTITDYIGNFDYGSSCAPELGVQTGCPVTTPPGGFAANPVVPTSPHVDHPLVGAVVQVPVGGRVQLANGSILLLKGDTAVSGGGSGKPPLSDTGVPFVFVDKGVRNSFTYFYSVIAFSVNSLKSGPSSLESPLVTKQVTPRKLSTGTTPAVLVSGVYGGDGTLLNPAASYPSINTTNGTFSANMPPPNDGSFVLTAAVLEALPQGDILLRIDSVSNGTAGGIGTPGPTFYLTLSAGGSTVKDIISVDGLQPAFSDVNAASWGFAQPLVPYDSANAKRLGIAFKDATTRMPVTWGGQLIPIGLTSAGIALAAGRFGNYNAATQYLAHSRWFAPGAAEPPNPTLAAGPDSSHNAGALPGVSKIWAPSSYRDPNVNVRFRNYGYAQVNWYPADFLITWNADSSITVFDSTNHSVLPYAPNGGSGWGFVNVAAFTAAGITAANLKQGGDTAPSNVANVTYNHFYGVHSVCDQRGIPCITLAKKAQYEALDLAHINTVTGNGIALWINGEGFIMAMPGIPAAGTKWRLRAVAGPMSATCTGTGPFTACSNYGFTGPSIRPSMAPGLTYKITVQTKYAVNTQISGDLSKVHTVPDPYYVTNALEFTANTKVLKFVNLPAECIIRIYSTSGILVQAFTHNDPTGGGEATWNLRNRNNQFVASGVYFYHIEAADGHTKVGRFTIVNFAP